MENMAVFTGWVTNKGLQAWKSLNSSPQEAQEALKLHGKSVLVKYKNQKENPTAKEIKNIVLDILQPVQTLEVTGVAVTIGCYLASKVMPWPISWICKATMVGSAYFTFQMWQAKDAILEEFFFFEKSGEREIDKEMFIAHVGDLANRALAKCTLFRLVTSADQTQSFRDMGTIIGTIIDSSKDEKELQERIDNGFFNTLSHFMG